MILTLGKTFLSEKRELVDDDSESAKHPQNEVKRSFRTCSQQENTNLQKRSGRMEFDEISPSENHVSKLILISDELAFYDHSVRESKKVSKFIRSLFFSQFEPLWIMSVLTKISFDQTVNSVHAEPASQGQNQNYSVPDLNEALPRARFAQESS